MATENKLAVLNLAVSCLQPGEVYLEVGTYLGTSVIGASLGNSDKHFVAIDDFSQFGGPEEQCRANIQRLAEAPVTLIAANAWSELTSSQFGYRIGVYFYDGGHTFPDQWRGLALAEPHLADVAIVIVDDASYRVVKAANRAFTKTRPQFEKILEMHSPRNGEPRWWNGIDVFAYRRDRSAPGRGPGLAGFVYGTPYEVGRNKIWPLPKAVARRALHQFPPRRG
jgi:predicted O-methyltransferase YrrM